MRTTRGFTLIEVMVSMAIGLFIVAATFTFLVDQNHLFEFTRREIDRDRGGRISLDLLVQDLRHAGVGTGYSPDGTFNGLMFGSFTVPGGASFLADAMTDDVGIRLANGSYRTIVQFGPGFGQVCSGGDYQKDDIVLFQSEDTFDARAAKILTFTKGMACLSGTCLTGCDSMTWEQDDTYLAGRSSFGADYEGGEMSGGFNDVVWFVFEGNLRRAEINSTAPCTSRNETCGQVVDFDVETLQARVLQWDSSTGAWEDRTTAQSVTDPRRVRVDIEMVVRSHGYKQTYQPAVELQLDQGRCIPGCEMRDFVSRRVLRTSVEVRNSGRMQLGARI